MQVRRRPVKTLTLFNIHNEVIGDKIFPDKRNVQFDEETFKYCLLRAGAPGQVSKLLVDIDCRDSQPKTGKLFFTCSSSSWLVHF